MDRTHSTPPRSAPTIRPALGNLADNPSSCLTSRGLASLGGGPSQRRPPVIAHRGFRVHSGSVRRAPEIVGFGLKAGFGVKYIPNAALVPSPRARFRSVGKR